MSETAKPAASRPLVEIAKLVEFITRALSAAGIPPEDAKQVAALMAEADARGGDAHGVFRLPQYVKQIQSGAVNPRPNIQVVNNQAGTALVDGDNALGHLVMKRATELAIEKARAVRRRLGGDAPQQSCGPGAALPANDRGAGHDRVVFLRGQHQSCASVGRHRSAAQHQSHRHRCAGIAASGHLAGHGHDEHRVWKNQTQGATRRADAGRLDDRPRRKTPDRSEARERGFSSSDRRAERIWAGADDRLAGRNVERRARLAATWSTTRWTRKRRATRGSPSWP